MKKTPLTILLVVIICALSQGCRKCEEERAPIPNPYQETSSQIEEWIANGELPPATQTGEHTMGCLINGVPWMPIDESASGNFSFDIEFQLTGDGLLNSSFLKEYNGMHERISIYGSPILSDSFNYPTTAGFGGGTHIDFNTSCGASLSDTTYASRHLNITRVDYENGILSGLFEMKLVSISCEDTIYITEGRFDLQGE